MHPIIAEQRNDNYIVPVIMGPFDKIREVFSRNRSPSIVPEHSNSNPQKGTWYNRDPKL